MSEIKRLANAGRAGWLYAIDRSKTVEQLWDATARAFLTAMREPGHELAAIGLVALCQETFRIDGPRPKLTKAQMEGSEEVDPETFAKYYMSVGATMRTGTEIVAAWQAMIDHILNEPE